MKKGKLFVALPLALALVAGSGLWVWAAVSETVTPACADITHGDASYQMPTQAKDALGNDTWTDDGWLRFTATLAAPSCLDVTYGVVVLSANPNGGTPTVLAATSVPGDATSNKITLDVSVTSRLPVDEEGAKLAAERYPQDTVCVYAYTIGSSGESATGKTGEAFDGTAGAEMLDRAPDGPTGTDPRYCLIANSGGSGGSSGYN
jgi:hypothetical protein